MLKIVYLDDEADLCQMFKDNFSSSQVSIRTFTNDEEAMASIKDEPPSLIFLDFRLNNTTGEIVAGKISGTIPTVLITGDLNYEAKFAFHKVFKKPYKFKEMKDLINSFLI